MYTPTLIRGIFCIYENSFLLLLLLFQVLGPRWMENRKPFRLQNTLIVYNAAQVIFSAWIFYEVSSVASITSILKWKNMDVRVSFLTVGYDPDEKQPRIENIHIYVLRKNNDIVQHHHQVFLVYAFCSDLSCSIFIYSFICVLSRPILFIFTIFFVVFNGRLVGPLQL